MVTMDTADNVLKSFYLDAVTESLNMKVNPFLAQIERTSENVVGKDVKKVLRMGLNAGLSAGTETGDLPKAKASNYKTFTAPLKNLYGTIEISDKAIRASANNEGAFVNLLNEEMNALLKSASFNFGRMLFGDGSGALACINNPPDSNGVVGVDKVENFVYGMYVRVYDDTENSYRVVDIDRENKTITLYKNDTMTPMQEGVTSSGENIYLYECQVGNELSGLGAIFGQAEEIYGLNKAANGLTPYVCENVGDISESVIQKAIDEAEYKSGSAINFIICSWGVRRALMEYYKNCNVALPTMEIQGGYTAINFHGIPIVVDRFCPNGTMYLLNTNSFKLYQLCDWEWLEADGGKILRQVPGKPVYTATLVKYAELMCDQPHGQAMLTGINEA